MIKLFQRPFNCYHHRVRYKALISLHVIDTTTFIIRFILLCIDLSKIREIPSIADYVIIIFLLELFGSLPFFFSNIVYFVTCCFKNELFHDDRHPVCCRRQTALPIATLTCFRCHCYQEHPQGMQLTRVVILMCCYILRFIAFILGASCAAIYSPCCVPYTVISSFALVSSFFTLTIEWFHFHVLWNFRPDVGASLTNRRDRSHLRFIPDKLMNEERIHNWRTSLCKYGIECDSNSLHHILLYHSIRTSHNHPVEPIQDGDRIIAYYVTTNDQAIAIAQYGFPVDFYRKLDPNIYFTRTVETWNTAEATHSTAIICVRLNIGHVFHVTTINEFDFGAHNNRYPLPQTLQLFPGGFIKVRFPGQIENWVITLRTNTNDTFDVSTYDGCI